MIYNVSKTCQIPNLAKIYTNYFGSSNNRYFVEVGAYDGEFVSNTSCLSDNGWNGIYIEPIYEFYLKCKNRHSNNEKVKVINCAVGMEEGEKIIFCGETLTTMDHNHVDVYGKIEWSKNIKFEEKKCKQMRLDNLLLSNNFPTNFDLLVVDVEGKEREVFESFDLNYWKPKMMIIELVDDHPSFQQYKNIVNNCIDLRNYICNNFYKEIYRDHINTVFVR